jgi:hypothetical protein
MQDLIEKFQPFLSFPIPAENLREHAIGLEGLRYELLSQKVQARLILQEKRRQMLWPKDKDMTELDRKTRMDADCAGYEKDYELLLGLEEIVKDRLELIKAMLPSDNREGSAEG